MAAHPIDDTLRRRAAFARADGELCNGYYAAAERDLAAMSAYYEADRGGGEGPPEFERRYIVAQAMSGRADGALALLRKTANPAPPRAYFNGDLCAAMKAFAAEDDAFPRSPDEHDAYESSGGSAHLKSAVDAACAGNIDGAVGAMRAVKGDATSLYAMMLGALYARQGKWAPAATQWWASTGIYPGVAAMEEIAMSDSQFESRWMLYYYRAHFAGL